MMGHNHKPKKLSNLIASTTNHVNPPLPSIYLVSILPPLPIYPQPTPRHLYTLTARNSTCGNLKQSKCLTNLSSAALLLANLAPAPAFSPFTTPAVPTPFPIAPLVLVNTSCILANTRSTARASGSSKASTSSALRQASTPLRSPVLFHTASRMRTTVSAANMSPVPLK